MGLLMASRNLGGNVGVQSSQSMRPNIQLLALGYGQSVLCTLEVRVTKSGLALTQIKIWLLVIWVPEKITRPELGMKETLDW